MQNGSKSIALTVQLPKQGRSGGTLSVACVLGRNLSINDFEVDLLEEILRDEFSQCAQPDSACNDNRLPGEFLVAHTPATSTVEEPA